MRETADKYSKRKKTSYKKQCNDESKRGVNILLWYLEVPLKICKFGNCDLFGFNSGLLYRIEHYTIVYTVTHDDTDFSAAVFE